MFAMMSFFIEASRSCPHDYCWRSWKNATQTPSNDRADYLQVRRLLRPPDRRGQLDQV